MNEILTEKQYQHFIMDYLKTRAPFWKRETTQEGERWIEGRDSDQQAADKWELNHAK